MDRRSTVGTLLAVLAATALPACADSSTTILSFAVPTEVAVDPADFLGTVSCSENAGAMRSYVLTLSAFEDEDDATAFVLGATGPTPCSLIAGFRDSVVTGQIHIAEIDGYDVPAASLQPFGGRDSGSRQMRDSETGEVVEPRWTTRCGSGAQDGAVAEQSRRAFVRPCEALTDSAPTPTQIAIGPSQVLGDGGCDVAPSFDIAPETGNLPSADAVACDAEPLVFEAQPGTGYDLYATALIDDALHGAICTATALRGVTVTARCNPLSANGRANVSLADVLSSDDAALCPAGHFFDVVSGDVVLNGLPLPCTGDAQIGPLEPGLTLLDVVVYDATGGTPRAGSCGVEIEPGKTTQALCLADD